MAQYSESLHGTGTRKCQDKSKQPSSLQREVSWKKDKMAAVRLMRSVFRLYCRLVLNYRANVM